MVPLWLLKIVDACYNLAEKKENYFQISENFKCCLVVEVKDFSGVFNLLGKF